MIPQFSKIYKIVYNGDTMYHKGGEKCDEVILDSKGDGNYTFVEKQTADWFGDALDLCDDDEAFFDVNQHEIDSGIVVLTEIQ